MWLCVLAGRFPPTSSELRLWQDVSRDEKLAGRGGWGWMSVIMASEQQLGQMRVMEEPSWGTATLRKHEPVRPKDIQLCGERDENPT